VHLVLIDNLIAFVHFTKTRTIVTKTNVRLTALKLTNFRLSKIKYIHTSAEHRIINFISGLLIVICSQIKTFGTHKFMTFHEVLTFLDMAQRFINKYDSILYCNLKYPDRRSTT